MGTEKHLICKYSEGVGALKDVCEFFNVLIAEPESIFQEYTDVVGNDLNGAPIEAGFPKVTWQWDSMSQKDYENLQAVILNAGNGNVYIHTRNNYPTSGVLWSNYSAIMQRPKVGNREKGGVWRLNVSIEFVGLVSA